MSPKFNIDRPKISDEEIKQHQNFAELVERFKQQSLKKARGDESWWQKKSIRYATVIAGVTVVCTITYSALFSKQTSKAKTHETVITQKTSQHPSKQAKSPFINAPAGNLKTPYSAYKVNNAKGGSITHSTSSKITIPKNSFVDKHGKDIVGDVTIEYKEFHDIGDLIVNGIPMAYDSAGTKFNLETAGMFDIKGSQNGEPVFIKPDKTLEVQLASATTEQRFNQYYLDTLERNWKYLKRDHATPLHTLAKPAQNNKNAPATPRLDALKHEIERVIPRKSDSVGSVYAARAEKLPRPKEPLKPVLATAGKPTFKLDGSYADYPELSAFDNVIFEVGPENKNYSRELHEITWSDVKITPGPVKGRNYLLTLVYRNRAEKLIVYPVLSGDDFDKAQKIYESKLESYQALVEKRTAEEKRLMAEMQAKQSAYLEEQKKKQETYDREKAAMLAKYNSAQQQELASEFSHLSLQAKATRLFSVSKFGIYNSDCPHPVPEGQAVTPIFAAGKQILTGADFIYLVDHSNKTVYGLTKSEGFRMAYQRENTYSICIFSRNTMYICDKAAFRRAVTEDGKHFPVTALPAGTNNLADFKKAIEI